MRQTVFPYREAELKEQFQAQCQTSASWLLALLNQESPCVTQYWLLCCLSHAFRRLLIPSTVTYIAYKCPWDLFPTDKMKVCALFLTKILTLHYTLGFYPFLLTQSSWVLSHSCPIFLLHKVLPPFASIMALAHSILACTL